jgi:putative transposase
MNSADALDSLCPLLLQHGTPEYIRSDNGSEFIAVALKDCLRKVGVKPIQIYAGSAWENGYNNRFNGTLRREALNADWFTRDCSGFPYRQCCSAVGCVGHTAVY